MILLRRIVDFLVYSNIFIGFCALAMMAATEIWWGISLEWNVLDLFVFCGTLSSYNLHRLVAFRNTNSHKRASVQWSLSKKEGIYFLFVLSVMGTGLCFLLLDRSVQWFLILFGFLTVFYSVPLFFAKKIGKFRELPGLKIFLIAFVWAGVSVVLPMVANDIPIFNRAGQLFLLERALFIFLITLPFDIRDMDLDKKEQIATIPNTFGINKTKWIAYLTIGLLTLLNLLNIQLGEHSINFWHLFGAFYLSIIYFIRYSSPFRHEMFCLFYVDGLMLLFFFCHLFLLM